MINDEVLDEIEKDVADSDKDDIDAENDDIDYETKDPVKKYQFEYNKSLYMANKYPEISANEAYTVSLAPGEGKIPSYYKTGALGKRGWRSGIKRCLGSTRGQQQRWTGPWVMKMDRDLSQGG